MVELTLKPFKSNNAATNCLDVSQTDCCSLLCGIPHPFFVITTCFSRFLCSVQLLGVMLLPETPAAVNIPPVLNYVLELKLPSHIPGLCFMPSVIKLISIYIYIYILY